MKGCTLDETPVADALDRAMTIQLIFREKAQAGVNGRGYYVTEEEIRDREIRESTESKLRED